MRCSLLCPTKVFLFDSGIDKNGYIFPLYENDGFELTEEGIQFKNIPANVDYLSITLWFLIVYPPRELLVQVPFNI